MASIRERNGKFNVIYSYTDADGKRKQKWETYATKAEAKKRQYVIPDDVHAWIMSHGGSKYIVDSFRAIISVTPQQ